MNLVRSPQSLLAFRGARLILILLITLAFLSGNFTASQAGTTAGATTSSWTSLDINTSYAGSTQEAGFQLTISGSGAGIGGTRDGFRYVYDTFSGDLQIQAMVSAWDSGGSPPAKGGLMMRASTDPSAAFALVTLTGRKGVTLQWRSADGKRAYEKSLKTSASLPLWLKLRKSGDSFSAFFSQDSVTWTQVGAAVKVAMGSSYLFGMAVTSGSDGRFAQATFDSFQGPPPNLRSFTPLSGQVGAGVTIYGEYLTGVDRVDFSSGLASGAADFTLLSPYEIHTAVPAGAVDGPITIHSPYGSASTSKNFLVLNWTSLDIGTSASGDTRSEGDLLSVKASGAGVGGTSDSFRYVYDTASGDLELTAQIASFDAGDGAQAGLMLRASTEPSAAYAVIYIDYTGNIFFRWRAADGQDSSTVQITNSFGENAWIKLIKSGTSVSAAYSLDGNVFLVSTVQTVSLPTTYLAGPATSAAQDGVYVYADYMYITAHPPQFVIGGSSQ